MVQVTAAEERQHRVEAMIQFHVRADVSALIEKMNAYPGLFVGFGVNEQCARALLARLDFEEPAKAAGFDVKPTETSTFTFTNPRLEQDGHVEYQTRAEAWQAACKSASIPARELRVVEHHLITEWLAERLRARGEVVVEFANLRVWTRTSNVPLTREPVMKSIALSRPV